MTAFDRIGRCLGYLNAEADPDHNGICCGLVSILRKICEVWKNVKFFISAAKISLCATARMSRCRCLGIC